MAFHVDCKIILDREKSPSQALTTGENPGNKIVLTADGDNHGSGTFDKLIKIQQEDIQFHVKEVLNHLRKIQAIWATIPNQEERSMIAKQMRKDIEQIHNRKEEVTKPKSTSSGETYSMMEEIIRIFSWFFSAKDEEAKTKVQILDSLQIKASAEFATALETMLGGFECLMFADPDRLNDDIPLIVVCVHSTRLKPDIEMALKQVNYTRRFFVLIVHTCIESNLPVISSSKKLGVYKSNVEFIDMGFDVDYWGIYECELNDSAMRYLEEYIKKFG